MKRALAVLVCGLTGNAIACGVCVEDKVAATYDHAVVTRAISHGQVVVFAEPRANLDAAVLTKKVAAAAAHARGVDPKSVRTAQSPLSLAFALDPRVATESQALEAVKKAAGVTGLQLVTLRVMR